MWGDRMGKPYRRLHRIIRPKRRNRRITHRAVRIASGKSKLIKSVEMSAPSAVNYLAEAWPTGMKAALRQC